MKHAARKRFGQHFLTDGLVIADIVAAIDPRPGEALVEIGPGLGAMTQPLVERCGRLTVIELDRDLAARLRRRADLTVIEADVLKVDFAALATQHAQPLRVVGNLPYNISTPILFHLLGVADRVVDQHFMLQKEVVARMAASPGHKDYGRLSVMLQWRYEIEDILDVPPESFDPPPRVDSAIVRMRPWANPPVVNAALLEEMVAVAFSQRRKLLRHTLGRWLEARGHEPTTGRSQGGSSPSGGDGLLPSGGGKQRSFDVQRRAEEVPVAEFIALAQALGR